MPSTSSTTTRIESPYLNIRQSNVGISPLLNRKRKPEAETNVGPYSNVSESLFPIFVLSFWFPNFSLFHHNSCQYSTVVRNSAKVYKARDSFTMVSEAVNVKKILLVFRLVKRDSVQLAKFYICRSVHLKMEWARSKVEWIFVFAFLCLETMNVRIYFFFELFIFVRSIYL